MQKLLHSFMSSNEGNAESPNVSPERRQRIKQINKLSLNSNQLSNSGNKVKQSEKTQNWGQNEADITMQGE